MVTSRLGRIPAPRTGGDMAPLAPYLPAVQLEWLSRDPDRPARTVEGTVVFADVSGFTPLTERLARGGKVGAEELTDVLNAVFGALLGVAERAGGDLLKFGGDALLLLFTGTGHAARAAGCASGLIEALRPYRRFRTSAGLVRLAMSVGIETGPVHLLLVGEDHRELLVVGPVVSAALTAESAASPGQVLVGPSGAAQLEVGAPVAAAPFAPLRLPTALVPAALPPAPGAAAELGLPHALRAHLAAGREDGEHRLAGLAFVQVRGTDRLAAAEGLDVLAAEAHAVVTAAQRACATHGVTFLATDVDADGFKVLLVAGAPRASERDEERLVLALRETVAASGRLEVRAGANHGRAFAVDVGTDGRRTYAVMGDATNLAARVMGRAEPGQVLATRALTDALRGTFALTPREPFTVKGKSHPVTASVVGPPVGVRAHEDHDLPFVGRSTERRLLDEVWATTARGRGAVVVLTGEAGIGKSRLVREFLAVHPDVPVLQVEGGRYAVATPYQAFRAPFRALLGCAAGDDDQTMLDRLTGTVERVSPEARPWLPLLATVAGVEVPDTPEVAALGLEFRATARHAHTAALLDRLMAGPWVVAVDDAHRLDDATADLLGHVAARVRERPWLVCVTRRPGEEGWVPDDTVEPTLLELPPLTEEESALVLQRVAHDRPIVPSARAAVAGRAGGNPLFLRELVEAVTSGPAGLDVAALPDSIEEVIGATVDQLDRSDRELLRVAAVLGVRFEVETLAAVLGRDVGQVAALLDRVHRFVTIDPVAAAGAGGSRHFVHGLIRDVAYEGLPFRRRRVLHARVAEALHDRLGEQESLVDLLALHYRAADRHEEAWRFARAAGERAQRGASPVEAARFYGWALEAAARVTQVAAVDRADVGERLGDVLELDGRYDDAAKALAAARREVADDEVRVAGLLKKQGWVRERSGRYSSALWWYTRALHRLDGRTDDDAARLRAQLSMAYGAARARQGRYAESLPHLHRAESEALRLGDEATLAHTYYLLDWSLTDLGRPEAARYREEALPIFERLGDLVGQASVLNNLGIDRYYEGRWDEARHLYERARDVCRRSGNVTLDGTALNNIGEILSDQGSHAEAEEVFREALALWRSVNFPVGLGLCLSNLGRVATRAGRTDAAVELFAESRRHFRRIGADSFLVELDSREAERLTMVADPSAALRVADDAARRAEALGGMPVVLAMLDRLRGVAYAQLGDLDRARRMLLASRGRATAAGADFELALTLHEWARLERYVDAPPAAALEVAARTILHRLGVRRVAEAPLPARVIDLVPDRAGQLV